MSVGSFTYVVFFSRVIFSPSSKKNSFAPAWSVTYKPRSLSHDGIISELYKKYLLQSKNLSQYKAFMAQQPTSNNVYYNWNENGLTLAQFINNARAKSSDAFSFNININTEETPKNSWANLGGYTGDKSFYNSSLSFDMIFF